MIVYKETKDFKEQDLKDLFTSVGWVSANYSDRLVRAMKNSDSVFSAWEDDRLVGLINVLDDGEMTAYAHYLLIDPKYQKSGIGSELLGRVREKYKDYLYIALNAECQGVVPFYEQNGFRVCEGVLPMMIFNP